MDFVRNVQLEILGRAQFLNVNMYCKTISQIHISLSHLFSLDIFSATLGHAFPWILLWSLLFWIYPVFGIVGSCILYWFILKNISLFCDKFFICIHCVNILVSPLRTIIKVSAKYSVYTGSGCDTLGPARAGRVSVRVQCHLFLIMFLHFIICDCLSLDLYISFNTQVVHSWRD